MRFVYSLSPSAGSAEATTISTAGEVTAKKLRFGTYESIDVSGISGKTVFYDSDIPSVVLSYGTGMLALADLVTDQKALYVSSTTSGGHANTAGTALDFGTGSGFIEAWATVESASGGSVTADRYLFQIGTTSQGWIAVYCNLAMTDTQTWKAEIKANDGTVLWATTDGSYNSYNQLGGPSTRPVHAAMAWSRAGDDLSLKLWINGALIINATKTTAGAAAKTVSLSANTVANSGIVIGNRGAMTANGWPGRIYTVRAYKFLPTDLQVNTRNRLGPGNLPEMNKPVWYLNLQNRSAWANPAQPEAYDGATGAKVTTFNSNGSSLNLDAQLVAYPGGAFPSAEAGGRGWRIPAGQQVRLAKPSGGKLVVYADSATDGLVRVTGAA